MNVLVQTVVDVPSSLRPTTITPLALPAEPHPHNHAVAMEKIHHVPPHKDLTTRLHRQKKQSKKQKQQSKSEKQSKTKQQKGRRRHGQEGLKTKKMVRFDQDANEYYDNPHAMTAQETADLCWYSGADYAQFRAVHKHCNAMVRQNALIWMDPHSIPATLLRIYETFRTAQTIEDVEPVWNATEIYHHAALVGLERTAIARIVTDYQDRRKACMDQIAWIQCQEPTEQWQSPLDRAALIRVASRQHSRTARLYARYVGDLVARTPY